MKRREFIKASAGASALTSFALGSLVPSTVTGAESAQKREYYELRTYRLKSGADHGLLDAYLERALIPGLNRLGIKPVGAFTEMEPKGEPIVMVLIPYPSLELFATAETLLSADKQYQKNAETYLLTPKSNPAFDRIETSLLLAFSGQPKIDLPPFSREKKPRLFELRTYESHSEQKALKKIQMFDDGEITIMHDVGLHPVFYGQSLTGGSLPNLVYMLSGEDRESYKKSWGGFGRHPKWNKLKADPQYADTVSKIISLFLKPTAYSQI